MRPMSDDETRAFLSEGTRTGKLAWVGRDGSPHVAPVWFVLDGDDSYMHQAGFAANEGWPELNADRDVQIGRAHV